jgi:hypothetical protein
MQKPSAWLGPKNLFYFYYREWRWVIVQTFFGGDRVWIVEFAGIVGRAGA